jgi:FKBP-type peptidyl-prolyl cis-trans isomerase
MLKRGKKSPKFHFLGRASGRGMVDALPSDVQKLHGGLFVRSSIVIFATLCLSAAFLCGCPVESKTKKPVGTVAKTPPAPEKAKPAPKAEPKKAEVKTTTKEIVFDPRNPPPGYRNCHRNHCHKVGGGVASYSQVMKEMGATKSINVPKRAPMPKAPADVAAPPADAKKTASGLAYKILKPGSGKDKPTATSKVVVHYTGWTTSGKAFDSSVSRNRPATIPLEKIPLSGWREGLQLISVGGEIRMWIPQELAFNGKPGRPKGMLVFDVELLGIK